MTTACNQMSIMSGSRTNKTDKKKYHYFPNSEKAEK